MFYRALTLHMDYLLGLIGAREREARRLLQEKSPLVVSRLTGLPLARVKAL